MVNRRVSLLFALAALAPAGALSGQNPSILTLLDPGARHLAVGDTQQARLGDGDWQAPNGSLLQAWRLEMTPGTSVTLDLVSDEFDAQLFLVGPGIRGNLSDDDSGGACNSRITHTSATGGTYTVVASTLGSGGSGAFTLSASSQPGPTTSGDCFGGTGGGLGSGVSESQLGALVPQGLVRMGEVREGYLTDEDQVGDRPVQAWDYQGTAGQQITVDVMSREFDTYLYLTGPGLGVQSDDDSGGACNARLTVTLPEDGMYRIGASAFSSSDGEYRVTVSDQPGPESQEPCPGSSSADAGDLLVLPTTGTLEIGGEFTGTLSAQNDASFDGSPVQAWDLTVEAGQPFNVDLISDDFDAMLYLVGPGIAGYQQNDDGAGACHSRLTHTAAESGTFRVVASSLVADNGAYTLVVSTEPGPEDPESCGGSGLFDIGTSTDALPALDTGDRVVTIGEPVPGLLSSADLVDGRVLQAWRLNAEAGATYTVSLDSDTFDALVYVTGPGIETELRDDDSGESTNARLTFTAEAGGAYQVVVSAWGSGGEGAFRLRVDRN